MYGSEHDNPFLLSLLARERHRHHHCRRQSPSPSSGERHEERAVAADKIFRNKQPHSCGQHKRVKVHET